MLEAILYILYGVLLGVFVIATIRLRFAYRHFRMKQLMTSAQIIEEMPGVTVCIPARNEDHAMTDCLHRVIASNYPKLEIIVLDDLSGDNTPALIKAFAQEGVRFVEGKKMPEGWLGKNHALNELLNEASGKYVLFMDVDTRIEPDSIEQLVAYMHQENARMISVLPRRDDGPRASVIFSTLRYFWEIMFHRKSAPATASNAWMIDRKTFIDRWGGFEPFKNAIQPESRLSAELMSTNEYRFLMGTDMLGISYEKKWRSQLMTSVRLLYPLLGTKVAHNIIALLDALIIASPLYILLSIPLTGFTLHHAIALGFYVAFGALYASYLIKVWKRGWIVASSLWGLIMVQEAILLGASAIAYKQKAVTWKGRLVKAK